MMKKFFCEFKEFAIRGNVMSLAVGMIIGMAFQGIVTSLTENLLSPILGLFIGQNFDNLELYVWGITLYYGAFITAVVNFFILAFIVFLLVRSINRLFSAKKDDKEEKTEYLCPFCMTALHEDAIRCSACTSFLGDYTENQITFGDKTKHEEKVD